MSSYMYFTWIITWTVTLSITWVCTRNYICITKLLHEKTAKHCMNDYNKITHMFTWMVTWTLHVVYMMITCFVTQYVTCIITSVITCFLEHPAAKLQKLAKICNLLVEHRTPDMVTCNHIGCSSQL